jgi:hypothetical protein
VDVLTASDRGLGVAAVGQDEAQIGPGNPLILHIVSSS